MTHLGERVSDLVDGQLPPEAAERAFAHLASCQGCRDQVEAERLMKARLAALALPTPREDLVQKLLAMGGPAGPVPPRAGHVPGSARPSTVPVEVGADLVGADLVGADLVGADLIGAELVGADLIGAELVGSELVGAGAPVAGTASGGVGPGGPESRRPAGSRRPRRLSAAAAAAVRPSTVRSTTRSPSGTTVRLVAGPAGTAARRGRRTRLTVAVLGALGAVSAGVGVLAAGGAAGAGNVVPTTTELSVIGQVVTTTRIPVLLDIPAGWQLTRRLSDRTSHAGGASGR